MVSQPDVILVFAGVPVNVTALDAALRHEARMNALLMPSELARLDRDFRELFCRGVAALSSLRPTDASPPSLGPRPPVPEPVPPLEDLEPPDRDDR